MIALVDVGDALHRLEMLEHVGVGDRDVDALEIEQVLDVVGGALRDDGQHAQILGVVDVAGDLGGEAKERAFGQAAGKADRPVVDLGDGAALAAVDSRRRARGSLRFRPGGDLGHLLGPQRLSRSVAGKNADCGYQNQCLSHSHARIVQLPQNSKPYTRFGRRTADDAASRRGTPAAIAVAKCRLPLSAALCQQRSLPLRPIPLPAAGAALAPMSRASPRRGHVGLGSGRICGGNWEFFGRRCDLAATAGLSSRPGDAGAAPLRAAPSCRARSYQRRAMRASGCRPRTPRRLSSAAS